MFLTCRIYQNIFLQNDHTLSLAFDTRWTLFHVQFNLSQLCLFSTIMSEHSFTLFQNGHNMLNKEYLCFNLQGFAHCTSCHKSWLSELDGHAKPPQLHWSRVLFGRQQHTVRLRRREEGGSGLLMKKKKTPPVHNNMTCGTPTTGGSQQKKSAVQPGSCYLTWHYSLRTNQDLLSQDPFTQPLLSLLEILITSFAEGKDSLT